MDSRFGVVPLTSAELDVALLSLPDWRESGGALHAAFRAPRPGIALALLAAIGEVAEASGHHPAVDWRYRHVFVRSTTQEAGDTVSRRDIVLAHRVSGFAHELDAVAEPGALRTVELAIDTADPAPLREVWLTALGYREGRNGDLVDPWGRGPTLWFQATPTPAGSRMHVDVYVQSPEAFALVEQTVRAGGSVVDASFAPRWWVVADVDGNRLCVATREAEADASVSETTEEGP